MDLTGEFGAGHGCFGCLLCRNWSSKDSAFDGTTCQLSPSGFLWYCSCVWVQCVGGASSPSSSSSSGVIVHLPTLPQGAHNVLDSLWRRGEREWAEHHDSSWPEAAEGQVGPCTAALLWRSRLQLHWAAPPLQLEPLDSGQTDLHASTGPPGLVWYSSVSTYFHWPKHGSHWGDLLPWGTQHHNAAQSRELIGSDLWQKMTWTLSKSTFFKRSARDFVFPFSGIRFFKLLGALKIGCVIYELILVVLTDTDFTKCFMVALIEH